MGLTSRQKLEKELKRTLRSLKERCVQNGKKRSAQPWKQVHKHAMTYSTTKGVVNIVLLCFWKPNLCLKKYTKWKLCQSKKNNIKYEWKACIFISTRTTVSSVKASWPALLENKGNGAGKPIYKRSNVSPLHSISLLTVCGGFHKQFCCCCWSYLVVANFSASTMICGRIYKQSVVALLLSSCCGWLQRLHHDLG